MPNVRNILLLSIHFSCLALDETTPSLGWEKMVKMISINSK
jgi:hypothetical protein